MIYEAILRAQSDKDAMLQLVTQFNPLITKYSRLLNYEDARQDLTCNFIEVIKRYGSALKETSDSAVTSYISKSIRNEYIKLSQARKKESYISYFDDEYYLNVYSQIADDGQDVSAVWLSAEQLLTSREYMIIKYVYEIGLSCCDTSRIIGLSRQAVTRIRNQAINKLRNHFEAS